MLNDIVISAPTGLQTVRPMGQPITSLGGIATTIRGGTRIVRQRSPITPGAQVKVVGTAPGSQPQIITIPAKSHQQAVSSAFGNIVNLYILTNFYLSKLASFQ